MICQMCARAADRKVKWSDKSRVNLHKKCTGCDCHHKPLGALINREKVNGNDEG